MDKQLIHQIHINKEGLHKIGSGLFGQGIYGEGISGMGRKSRSPSDERRGGTLLSVNSASGIHGGQIGNLKNINN